jgi:hypothetical protein
MLKKITLMVIYTIADILADFDAVINYLKINLL